jgi:type I restriction enzyme S subunit
MLVGITGQGKTRGMAAPLMFEATINQHLAYIKPALARLSDVFLLRVLQAGYVHLRTESESAGSTKGAITCDQLARLGIPLPPLHEQHTIAAYLDTAAGKFDALVREAEQGIDLLRERRSALIAAAVTGKIDVRDTSTV